MTSPKFILLSASRSENDVFVRVVKKNKTCYEIDFRYQDEIYEGVLVAHETILKLIKQDKIIFLKTTSVEL